MTVTVRKWVDATHTTARVDVFVHFGLRPSLNLKVTLESANDLQVRWLLAHRCLVHKQSLYCSPFVLNN